MPELNWAGRNAVTCENAFVEVGGIEPAAGPFRPFLFSLVNVCWPRSEHVFDAAARSLSRPFAAYKPRHVRVAASFSRHVSALMIEGRSVHVRWPWRALSQLGACLAHCVEAGIEGRLVGLRPQQLTNYGLFVTFASDGEVGAVGERRAVRESTGRACVRSEASGPSSTCRRLVRASRCRSCSLQQ